MGKEAVEVITRPFAECFMDEKALASVLIAPVLITNSGKSGPDMAGRPPGGSADGRQRLLDACWNLLQELPVGVRLTISAVCDRAGCTPPTLYHHFGDLSTLERAASRRAYVAWSEDLETVCASKADPQERLLQRGRAHLEWANEHVDAYHALFSQPRRSQDPDAQSIEAPGFQALLADLGEVHDLPSSDATLLPLAFAFWSGVHGLASLAVTVPFFPKKAQESALEIMAHSFVSHGLVTESSVPMVCLRVAS